MDATGSIFSLAFSLFILMDPIGNVPIFLSLLKTIDEKRQRWIIFRELLIALVTIILFNFLGEPLLKFLGIRQHTILIAGGIILFLIALKMIFPVAKGEKEGENFSHKEPFIVPLAIPLVAGPAVLASVMIYSRQTMNAWIMITAIILAWSASTILLLLSSSLKKLLGSRGLLACERLMGLVLILIAIEMFLDGLQIYLGHPVLAF